MTEDELQEALFIGIDAAVNNAFPVQWPLRKFTPPESGKWLEIRQMTNNPTGEYWGKERSFRGFVRVIFHWPIIDSGSIEPTRVLRQLAQKIPKGTRFDRVVMTDNPNIGEPILDNGAIILPMTLYYRTFVV